MGRHIMTVLIPRESIEFVEVDVTVNGAAVVSGVQLAVVPSGARPTGWANPTALGGKIGYLTAPVALAAPYDIWAQVASSPETPVIFIDTLIRT
jgi:hypothetical protein